MSVSNPPYTQIPTTFIADAMHGLDGAAVRVYLVLCSTMAATGRNRTEIGNIAIAANTGLGLRGVQKALRQLEAAGAIRRRERKPGPNPNVIEVVIPDTVPMQRPAPKDVREWIAELTQESYDSPRIDDTLLKHLRAAANANETKLVDALRCLYRDKKSYDLQIYPECLIADVAQHCRATRLLSA